MAFWKPIATAPKDRVIEVRGDAAPYGITSWTGKAKWGSPDPDVTNIAHEWLTEDGAVLRFVGYIPTDWR